MDSVFQSPQFEEVVRILGDERLHFESEDYKRFIEIMDEVINKYVRDAFALITNGGDKDGKVLSYCKRILANWKESGVADIDSLTLEVICNLS